MIARIRKGNDFKHVWPITWNGQPEDFSDATDITLTATVYGQVKTLVEGVDYHIDGGNVVVDFTPTICDITGTYTVELNYIKPSAEFIDGDRRSAVDVQAFQIVNTSAEANATEGVSLPSEAMADYALKYDDLTEEQKDELRGKGITSIDLTGEVGDTKTYTITYADGLTFDFSVTDGHTPIFAFVGTVLHIDGVPKVDLKGEMGNGIASVELTSTVGLVKTYTITFTDATTTTFTVTDGSTPEITFQGTTIYVDGVAGPDLKGETGNGIASVELTSTVGLVKTYTITFTDSTTFDYVVTDGAAGTGAGDMLKSEYDLDGNGVVDNAEKVGGFTVETNVPANAKFTDTVYTHPTSHPYSMITGAPDSLPANGGDSATVNGKTVEENVPAGAKFTDTIYSHPTSDGNLHVPATGTTNNGKVLKAGATAGSLAWETDNDTITTINGKTGAITKADIVALGIPAQDTVYTHPAGTNPHGTTKADVGLGNVDNTSDVNKPVSTAQQTAIDSGVAEAKTYADGKFALAIPLTQKGAASGVAELDTNGKVLSSQLPSYVDDVLNYTTQSNFPATGESGKIYIAEDTNKTYRWTGSVYVEISPSIALGETSSTAYRGDRGKVAYDHSQAAHAPSDAQKNSDITKEEIEAKLTGAITSHTHSAYVPTSRTVAGKALTNDITLAKGDVGLGNVDNTSDADKPISTAQQTALDAKIDASKFQVVDEMPGIPTAGVFYFVKE